MNDNVNRPAHYMGEIETIDFIRDKLTPEQFEGYCIGNSIKYLSRYQKKGAPLEDLQKAQVYLGWAIDGRTAADPARHSHNPQNNIYGNQKEGE